MRSQAFSFVLTTVTWDVFCTLTFADEVFSRETAVRYGLEFMERLRVKMRLRESEFYWFLRPERGDRFGRWHLHALVKVLPRYRGLFIVKPGFVSWMHRAWGLGITKVRPVWGPEDPATLYLQIGESSGADLYEGQKSAAAIEGIPSGALIARALLHKSVGGVCWPAGAGKGRARVPRLAKEPASSRCMVTGLIASQVCGPVPVATVASRSPNPHSA